MKIGIDFGTSFSLPAGVINGSADTLLPNGEYGIPSVFYYDSEVGIQIGKDAEYNAEFYPMNVRRDIKMDIRAHEDSFTADGRTFSKKEIIGHIFREITRVAQEQSERRELSSQSIDGAVISVPAAFDLRELSMIREAAQRPECAGGAGLNVLGFIREPVAAAIAYFNAPGASDKKTILVYDLGGGTCDVAIVRADREAEAWYRVLDSKMERIGGRNWDGVLAEVIRRKLNEKIGRDGCDADTENRIRRQAVEVKHILTTRPSARATVSIAGKTYSCVITAEEFEEATAELLQNTMTIVKELIRKCNAQIDYIVCVGGSSNMPQIRKSFEQQYPEIPVKVFQPEKAIAFGAAIYAEQLENKRFLRDICKYSYGARYVEDYRRYHDPDRLRIWNIVYKDGELPAKGTSTSTRLRNGDHDTYIAIYESECTDEVYLPEQGTYIGDITITGIKGGKEGDETVLTMQIDQSGLMVLEAVDRRTGKSARAQIQLKDF
ncbi:MAG: Hsp70 family protein [Eubacteriales bacterium]|nr:Hsp70 family protein [Eubacteriales bacterium]